MADVRFEPLSRRRLPIDTIALAKFLIGKTLVRDFGGALAAGRIVETEAYLADDPAAHGFNGVTNRNRSMFLSRGYSYVYRIYGMWHCVNVSGGREHEGAAVLVRALEPIAGLDIMHARRNVANVRDLARGPGRLCEALGIDCDLNGVDMCAEGPLWLAGGAPVVEIGESVRIGITKAADRVLRFYQRGSPFVSGPAGLRE